MHVILLVGLPGAGKSTLCQTQFPTYYRISQDDVGNKQKCIQDFIRALEQGKDCIIDRTNINRNQRSLWIDIALNYGADVNCVVLSVPEEEAIARIHLRKNHPTITEEMTLDKKRSIVYSFSKDYEAPDLSEGFSSILFTRA